MPIITIIMLSFITQGYLHADSDIFDYVKYNFIHSVRNCIEEKGTSVNIIGTETEITPLHMASIKGHLDIVKYLVRKGANIYYTTPEGYNAPFIAKKQGHADVYDYFELIW